MNACKILVADKDADTLSLIETRLQVRDYEVFVATHSDEAARLARKVRFDLVLIGSNMERIEGGDLCEKLKHASANFSAPVILLAHDHELRQLALSPHRGFDDFLIKPFDAFSLQLRVELTLTRSSERLQANPLTNLPGTIAVQSHVTRRIERHEIFSVCYIDVNHFKSFNDRYGFDRGDAVIRHTGRLIAKCLEETSSAKNSFLGHIGGDDFIVVMDTELESQFALGLLQEFDRIIPTYYDDVDRKRRSIFVKNRNGVPCSFPIVSVCVAAVTNKSHPYASMAEIVRDAAEVKAYLKTQPGSHYLRDRRAEPLKSLEDSLQVIPVKQKKSKDPQPLGQMLLAIGLINDAELAQAVRRHVETGERIGQVLLRMNAVTSAELGRCLSEKLGVEYVSIKDHVLSDDLADVWSMSLIKSGRAVPIALGNNCVEVAMVDPLDRRLVEEIQELSGRQVIPKLALENEFEAFLEHHEIRGHNT